MGKAFAMEELHLRKPRRTNGIVRDPQDLGDTIRARRRELGLTQVQLAGRCDCSPRFIGELERGIAAGSIRQVLFVCHTLGIDLFARVRGEYVRGE